MVMFFMATMTLTPRRMARKLVASWFLRSKISRQTKVWSFMAGQADYFATGEQHPGLPEQPSAAFRKAALRLVLVVAPSNLVTITPGGATTTVAGFFVVGTNFNCAMSLASFGSLGSSWITAIDSDSALSALISFTPFMAASLSLVWVFCRQTSTSRPSWTHLR